jgi:hypothetical protein
MLLLTMIKEQEIYAWTRRLTQGQFLDVAVLEETEVTGVYVIAKRFINGRYVKYIEKIAPRIFDRVDESVFLDAALSLPVHHGVGKLTLSALTGSGVTATSSSAEFTIADVDKIIRYGQGKARVTGYTSTTVLTITVIDDFDQAIPFSNPVMPRVAEVGEWTLDAEITVLTGLHHLEGKTVSALADGNVVTNLVVSGGSVTLTQAASRITVGLPYTSTARNMPMAVPQNVIENKVKNITHMAIRLRNSRGLKAGSTLDALYPLKPRAYETFGEANKVKNGTHILAVEPFWDIDSTAYCVQEEPLPVTILGWVLESEIGDDPN